MIWATFDMLKSGFEPALCGSNGGCKSMGAGPGLENKKHLSIDTMTTAERETMPYQLCFQLSLAVMSFLFPAE
jgi:hypothetical protein